jgi:hypothetical protein
MESERDNGTDGEAKATRQSAGVEESGVEVIDVDMLGDGDKDDLSTMDQVSLLVICLRLC